MSGMNYTLYSQWGDSIVGMAKELSYCVHCLLRSRRRPLNTMIRLAPISAHTAIQSVAIPLKASTRNTALMLNAMTIFRFKILTALVLRPMNCGILRKSSSINATSAVSSAVPATPMTASGAVYLSAALVWLWLVNGIKPGWGDMVGVGLALCGAGVIALGHRSI